MSEVPAGSVPETKNVSRVMKAAIEHAPPSLECCRDQPEHHLQHLILDLPMHVPAKTELARTF